MDIIIVSCGKTPKHRQMTQNAINSCINSGGDFDFYIIETCDRNHIYKHANTIRYFDKEFNYNKCLNLGTRQSKGQYIAYCNNDLVFHKDWAANMLHAFNTLKYLSLCPLEPNVTRFKKGNHLIEGYDIGQHIPGWCICVNRDIWKKLGQFNEAVEFWYSDNLYGQQLLKHNIQHALVCNSVVEHIGNGSQTLNTENRIRQRKLTNEQTAKYNNALKKLK